VKNTSTRIGLICALLVTVFTLFAWRLIYLQVVMHDYFSRIAAEKNCIHITIPARRGRILDRNGEELAVNIPVRTVTADGTHIHDPGALATLAAPYLDMSVAELAEKLSTQRRYVVIRKEVSEDKAQDMIRAMDKAGLHGLYLEEGSIRSYPNNEMLCHVLGFVDHSGHGAEGIEKVFDKELSGHDGFRLIEHDRKGREIVIYRGQEQPPQEGSDIRLTIDMGLQAIVEQEVDATYKQLHPAGVTAVLADPNTGEILAMACRPNFDPNLFNQAKPDQMRNRAISDMYEPGSTFKIVVTSAAFNEGIVDDNTRIFCENGHFSYGGKVIKDHHGNGDLSIPEILMKSSNIGAAKIALRMSDQSYYDYVRRFGFGQKTDIPLDGEISGMVNPIHRWDKLTKTRMAFGQSVAVTPIQMVMAMSCIANGGKLLKPRLVLDNGQGSAATEAQPLRQVVSEKTAHYIAGALQKVVSAQGTAPLAHIDGFTVAGKTGTAQKIGSHGGYMEGRYIVSFAGFLPAEAPRLMGLVIVDDAPLGSEANYGGMVAAPVFSRIGGKAACYLDMQPDPALTMAQTGGAGTSPAGIR
jgi:cell division protein FtsI (penicillin-binding protein 3)/stage V sporulation protein D (sporulation-specific penicillin-binding protein)